MRPGATANGHTRPHRIRRRSVRRGHAGRQSAGPRHPAAGGRRRGCARRVVTPRPGSLESRRQGEMTMTEEDVRKAWSMARRAAEWLAQEAAKLEAAATGDDLRDASLLAAQRSARDL